MAATEAANDAAAQTNFIPMLTRPISLAFVLGSVLILAVMIAPTLRKGRGG